MGAMTKAANQYLVSLPGFGVWGPLKKKKNGCPKFCAVVHPSDAFDLTLRIVIVLEDRGIVSLHACDFMQFSLRKENVHTEGNSILPSLPASEQRGSTSGHR